MSRPPLTYFGGKTTAANRIVALLPPHWHYVEPFAGSLAVLLAKPAAPMETANDLDSRLITFWRVLRDRPRDLARACALTPHARREHATAREDCDDELEQARRTWVLLTQGRGGTSHPTGWRYYQDPAGSGTSMPDYLDAYVARIEAAARRLHAVSLECRPALDVITAYGRHSDVLIYADPPYLGATRPGSVGRYQHDMPSEDDHRALAEALLRCQAAVVISGYPSSLYDDLYRDWHRTTFPSFTGQAGTNWATTEVLWSNRPPADDLFTEATR